MVTMFYLFESMDYYPTGGIDDLVSAHDIEEDAIKALMEINGIPGYSSAHIVELPGENPRQRARRFEFNDKEEWIELED